MKKMKKLFAVLLAFAMVMGMSLTTFAANTKTVTTAGVTNTGTDKGTISIAGITKEANLKVYAYKIVAAKYDANGFDGYDVVYKDAEPAITVNADDEYTIGQAELNAVIKKVNVNAPEYELKDDDNDGVYSQQVPVGSYLVLVLNAETKVYSPIVVSVSYVNNEETNGVTGVESVVVGIESETAWVKVSNVPTITKTEADTKGNTLDDGLYGNSVNIGDEVTYTVTVNNIPYYGGDNPELEVVDTLSAGLTYVADSLEVKINGNKFTNYDLDVNGQVIKVNFVTDDGYTLNAYQGSSVVITYKATLNNNAVINGNNNNTVVLNYTRDSKVTTAGTTTDPKNTYTYTFDLTNKLLKTGENDVALAGATFELYTDAECTTKYTNSLTNGVYVTTSDDETTADVNEAGKLEIKGLEEGTYYLKETIAPAGYSLNTHVYKIVVDAIYNADSTLDTWGIYVDDAEEMTNQLIIPNTKISSLPSTGGIGTAVFTIGGCAIMIAAAYFFFVSRKKEA